MTTPTNSNETDQVFAAFVAAQGDFRHVVEDSSVPVATDKETRRVTATAKFATLPAVLEHVRPILNKHGLAVTQPIVPAQGGVRVRTRVVHASGQWFMDDGIFIPAAKADPQGHGSALSYARRYSILSALGIATSDDDGAAALAGIQVAQAAAAAQAAADAVPKVDERQFGILMAIARIASPTTTEDRLEARYRPMPEADFDTTLAGGLAQVVKLGKLTDEQAEAVRVAADGAEPLDDVLALIAGGAS